MTKSTILETSVACDTLVVRKYRKRFLSFPGNGLVLTPVPELGCVLDYMLSGLPEVAVADGALNMRRP